MKCLRCGHPCVANLFSSSIGCTNPDCPFFENEIIRLMEEAKRLLEKVR